MNKSGIGMLVVAALVATAGAIAGQAMDPTQQSVVSGGWLDPVLRLLGRVVDKLGDVLTHPNVLWSVFAVLVGAVLSVLVVEFLKRFAPLLPKLFEGELWVLKIRLCSALIGGGIAAVLDWRVVDGDGGDTFVFALVSFIAAAAASPTLYDLAYKLAPNLTDRLLKRVRGEA